MNFHARAAGIGENCFHTLPLETGNKDLAAGHCRAEVGSFSSFLRFSLRCFAHSSCGFLRAVAGNKKPTTVCQPWVFVEIPFMFDKRLRPDRLRQRPAAPF